MIDKQGFQVHYEYEKLVSLTDLSTSLSGLSKAYAEYCKATPGVKNTDIVVTEVRKGSFIFDLLTCVPKAISGVLPMIEQTNEVASFINHLASLKNWLLHGGEKPESVSKQELEAISKTLDPVAKDTGAKLTIGQINAESVVINCPDANIMQNQIRSKIKELEETDETTKNFDFVVMSFKMVDGEMQGKDKAYIDSIAKDKAVVVSYATEQIKQEILSLPIFKKLFLVDVRVKFLKGSPKFYHILRLLSVEDKDDGNDDREERLKLDC